MLVTKFRGQMVLARFALRVAVQGKSGAYRDVTFYTGPDIPVFLLNVFAKGDRINLTKAEHNELKAILSNTVKVYRRGV
jgi:hypothetical protein